MGDVEELFETRLRDGRRVLFRRIRPDDKQRLAEGVRQLSPESRYLRFFHHVEKLSAAQLRYLTEVDFEDHFAWIGTLSEETGEPGIGVGRWIRSPDDPTIAEGAVTVLDDFHNMGIGKTLLWLMARSAIQHGITAFRAWTLGDNTPMLEMLKDFGAQPGRWEMGVLEVLVPLPPDVEELDATPAPLVLKAAATGAIHGQASDPLRPLTTRLLPRIPLRNKSGEG